MTEEAPLPVPACALGFTEAEVLAAVGERHRESFRRWVELKAHPTCTGQPPCAKAHGPVWLRFDVEQFVERVPGRAES